MSVDRNSPAARQQAVVAEMDAIEARRLRGELTAEEAEAQNDAAVRKALAETAEWARTTQEGRAHQRRLRMKAVIVAVVIGAMAFALLRVYPELL